jgi:hypothetical protein
MADAKQVNGGSKASRWRKQGGEQREGNLFKVSARSAAGLYLDGETKVELIKPVRKPCFIVFYYVKQGAGAVKCLLTKGLNTFFA